MWAYRTIGTNMFDTAHSNSTSSSLIERVRMHDAEAWERLEDTIRSISLETVRGRVLSLPWLNQFIVQLHEDAKACGMNIEEERH